MTYTRDTALSVRSNIMGHLQERFQSVTPGTAPWATYTVNWNLVQQAPLQKADIIMGDALSLLDVKEKTEAVIGLYRCDLQVAIEYYHAVDAGDDPSTSLNRLLTDVQRTMMSDIYCGQMSMNMVELGSENDIGAQTDRTVHGVSFWKVTYQRKLNDPTKLRGE